MTNTNHFPPRILDMIAAFIAYANDPIRLDPADFDDLAITPDYFDNMHPNYFKYEILDSNRYALATIDNCNAIKFSCYIECDIELIAFFDDYQFMTALAISSDTTPYELITYHK